MDGLLPDLLERRSRMAEQAGQPRQALDDAREVIRLLGERNVTALRSDEASLETRYAAREKELRIQTLEHENRLQELALKTAQSEAAEHVEAQQRQALVGMLTKGVSVALILIAGLLYLLLRAQRRYASELRIQALRDPLTGVDNRRAFMQRAAPCSMTIARRAWAHVLMLIDFDHFKRVNDSAGHPQGDRVLSMVADYLSGAIARRRPHRAHRWRGVCRAVSEARCRGRATPGRDPARRRRRTVSCRPQCRWITSRSASAWRCSTATRCHDLGSWMRAADAALYSAKSFGRNRVVASSLLH